MGEEIEKETNGRIKFTVYWAESIGKGREQFNMVKNGVADMSDFPGVWAPGKFTLSGIADLPFAAQNNLNILKTMNLLYGKGFFSKQWNEVDVLGWTVTSPVGIFFRKIKPMTLEELAGLKARASGGVQSEYVKALKMVPVNVMPSDAYLAWDTGVVDAFVHAPATYIKYKFYEIPTRSFLNVHISVIGNAAMIMNKEKMASLPPDIQSTVREVAKKYCEVYAKINTEEDVKAIDKMKQDGVEVYLMPPEQMKRMRDVARPIWEKYVSDMEKAGLPGGTVAKEFVDNLRKLGENPPYSP
jgi:TRAP-type C4-dicarboxylate transport system substrate-binding protein